jgi:putative transposase
MMISRATPTVAYLAVTNVFALLRLLPVSDRDKDAEILALRHQITVLQRQLGAARPRFSPADRTFLTALLHRLPRNVLSLSVPKTCVTWADALRDPICAVA